MRAKKFFRGGGNSQAVRIPAKFQRDTDEAGIFRRSDELVLRKKLNRYKPYIFWFRCPPFYGGA